MANEETVVKYVGLCGQCKRLVGVALVAAVGDVIPPPTIEVAHQCGCGRQVSSTTLFYEACYRDHVGMLRRIADKEAVHV